MVRTPTRAVNARPWSATRVPGVVPKSAANSARTGACRSARRPFRLPPTASAAARAREFFFERRPPPAGQTDAVARSIHQVVLQFLATPANRLYAQSADQGHEAIAPMTQLLGLQRHQPTAL